jgi:hypothetical protein
VHPISCCYRTVVRESVPRSETHAWVGGCGSALRLYDPLENLDGANLLADSSIPPRVEHGSFQGNDPGPVRCIAGLTSESKVINQSHPSEMCR